MRSVLLLLAAIALWPAAARAQPTDPLHAALDGYVVYQIDVSALLDANINSAAAMDDALERAVRHDPVRVARGWIAYGALTAAQSPAFAAGVQSRVRAAGRAPVVRQLRRDLGYARRRPPGSAEAVRLILSSVAADSERLSAAGRRYEHIGAAIDSSAWIASSDRTTREARLRRTGGASLSPAIEAHVHVSALAANPLSDDAAFGGRSFWDALSNRDAPTPLARVWRENHAQASTTDRMLTLAALFVVGATGNEPARVAAMLDEPRVHQCLALEQLQLRQCASVAHDPSEDAFCLARHGLSGPGACFGALIH